jgi:4-amino-4-deoxy-L-arabinose transferase-like glycosyltransferase
MSIVAHAWLSFLQAVLSVPLLLFLPGYVTRLALLARRPERVEAAWLEFCFQCLLFSVLLTGWVSLVLVGAGWFSLSRLLLCNVCYTLALGALVWRRSRSWRVSLRPPDRSAWLLLGLVAVAAVLFFRPHEFIFGGADAGVYVSLGANIARTGSWLVRDPAVASADPKLYPALFRAQPSYFIPRYIQFPGFYLADEQPGLIIPQFYPLHPVWLAIAYSLGGLWASLFVTPLWGLMGCLAVYFTTKTLFGRRVGLLAAGLLAITAPQIWFSRYPTSEVLTQLLLFGGMYTFALYVSDESPWTGLLAGLALGQVSLARIDVYFLLALPVCYAAYLGLKRRFNARHLVFFGSFLAMVAHSLLFAALQSWPYFCNTYSTSLRSLPLPWPLLVAFGVAGLAGFLFFGRWAGRHPGWAQRLAPYGHRALMALGLLVILAALYGYFVRPLLADATATSHYWYGDNEIPDVEPYNLVRLGWYISPLGIGLAVAGMWWMLRHEANERTAAFLGIGLFFSFFFLYRSRNNPHHIYVMRRYLPAVIPTFMVGAAYALGRWLRRTGWRRWCAIGLAVVLAGWLVYDARVVIPHVEYQGAMAQLEPLVRALGDDDPVVLFNDDLPVSTGAILGTPLRYIYGYTVFDLQEEYVDVERLSAQARRWHDAGRRVLVAFGPNAASDIFPASELTPVTAFHLDVPVLEASYEHFPQQIWRYAVDLQVYEWHDP